MILTLFVCFQTTEKTLSTISFTANNWQHSHLSWCHHLFLSCHIMLWVVGIKRPSLCTSVGVIVRPYSCNCHLHLKKPPNPVGWKGLQLLLCCAWLQSNCCLWMNNNNRKTATNHIILTNGIVYPLKAVFRIKRIQPMMISVLFLSTCVI